MATNQDAVLSKIRDLQRFRREQYKRAALALPGGLSAARTQGIGAMREHVQSFFPQPGQRTDPMEKFALKADIAKNMAAAAAKMNDQKVDAADKFKAQTDLLKAIFDFAEGIHGNQATVQSARNTASASMIASIHNNTVDAQESIVGRMLADSGGGSPAKVNGALQLIFPDTKWTARNPADPSGDELMMDAYDAGTSIVLDKRAREKIQAAMQDPSLTPREKTALLLKIKTTPGYEGVFGELINDPIVGPYISENADMLNALASEFNQTIQESGDAAIKTALESLRGVPGMETVANQVIEIANRIGAATTPEEVQKQLQDFIDKNIDPTNKPALEAMEKLLDQMDVPEEQMPTHIAEAKRQLFESAEFQAEKARLGFTTDKAYFDYAKKKLKDQNFANKMKDSATRQSLEARQGVPSSAETGRAIPNAKQIRAAKTDKPGTAAAAGDLPGASNVPKKAEPTVKLNGVEMSVSEAAAMSGGDVPDEGEVDIRDIPSTGGLQPTPGGYEAQLDPVKRGYGIGSRAIDDKQIRTPGQLMRMAGNVVFRPENTAERASQMLAEMFKKAKKKNAELGRDYITTGEAEYEGQE